MRVPASFPVRPLLTLTARQNARSLAQCGTCHRYWDDGIATAWTPVPAGRCPFEYYHGYVKSTRKGRKQ